VKSLDEITVLNEKFKGFWMEKAYRIPTTPDAQESPDKLATETIPITAHSVRSLFASPQPGAQFKAGEKIEIEGVALDSGKGITQVEVSVDGGQTWSDARLDPEISRYSWRRWRINWTPERAGRYRLMCRASNAAGEKQTTHQWNRSGYQRNVIEQLDVTVEEA
jgi:hypothetical protein